jgi:hypothetical protein
MSPSLGLLLAGAHSAPTAPPVNLMWSTATLYALNVTSSSVVYLYRGYKKQFHRWILSASPWICYAPPSRILRYIPLQPFSTMLVMIASGGNKRFRPVDIGQRVAGGTESGMAWTLSSHHPWGFFLWCQYIYEKLVYNSKQCWNEPKTGTQNEREYLQEMWCWVFNLIQMAQNGVSCRLLWKL